MSWRPFFWRTSCCQRISGGRDRGSFFGGFVFLLRALGASVRGVPCSLFTKTRSIGDLQQSFYRLFYLLLDGQDVFVILDLFRGLFYGDGFSEADPEVYREGEGAQAHEELWG